MVWWTLKSLINWTQTLTAATSCISNLFTFLTEVILGFLVQLLQVWLLLWNKKKCFSFSLSFTSDQLVRYITAGRLIHLETGWFRDSFIIYFLGHTHRQEWIKEMDFCCYEHLVGLFQEYLNQCFDTFLSLLVSSRSCVDSQCPAEGVRVSVKVTHRHRENPGWVKVIVCPWGTIIWLLNWFWLSFFF